LKELRGIAAPAAVLTVVLGVVIVFRPVPFGLAFRMWLVAVGALAAAALVRGTLAPYRQVRVHPVRFRTAPTAIALRPAGLEEVERAVDFAAWNPSDLRLRLLPLLREVAAHRLLSRRGIDLDRNPADARLALGETTWALVGDAPSAEPKGLDEALGRLEDL
jgi:hypothetical protein